MPKDLTADDLDRVLDAPEPATDEDIESAFDQGAASVLGESEPAPEPELEPAPAPAPEPVKSDREKSLEDRLRVIEGRYGTLNSQYKTLFQQHKELREEGVKAPTREALKAAMEDEAKLGKLKDDFPDFFEGLEAQGRLMENRLSDRFNGFDERLKTAQQQAAHEARQLALLDISHPEWETIVSSEQFVTWAAAQQDESVKALIRSDNGRDVRKLLDMFQEQNNPAPKTDHRQELKESVTPAPKGRATTSKAPVEDLDAAFTSGFKTVRGSGL